METVFIFFGGVNIQKELTCAVHNFTCSGNAGQNGLIV